MTIREYPRIKKTDYIYFSDLLETAQTLEDLIIGLTDIKQEHGNHVIDIDSSDNSTSITAYICKEREETDEEYHRRCQSQMESDQRTRDWQRKEFERLKKILEEGDEK